MMAHDPLAMPKHKRMRTQFFYLPRLQCLGRLHRKAGQRRHTPLRQLLIRHQTATLCRGWR